MFINYSHTYFKNCSSGNILKRSSHESPWCSVQYPTLMTLSHLSMCGEIGPLPETLPIMFFFSFKATMSVVVTSWPTPCGHLWKRASLLAFLQDKSRFWFCCWLIGWFFSLEIQTQTQIGTFVQVITGFVRLCLIDFAPTRSNPKHLSRILMLVVNAYTVRMKLSNVHLSEFCC